MSISKRIAAGAVALTMMFCNVINCGSTTLEEPSAKPETIFNVNVPSDWTNHCYDWIEQSDDIQVYYRVRYGNEDINGDWHGAQLWHNGSEIRETDRSGADIIFFEVMDGELLNTEYRHFFLDREDPENFSVTTADESYTFKLKSEDTVKDLRSGVEEVYYTVNDRLDTIEDIRRVGKHVGVQYNDEYSVSFNMDYTREMYNKNVYFYAVDRADNFRVSQINPGALERDTPKLTVDIDENKWYNLKTRKSGWTVETDTKGAKIYYITSDEDKGVKWGDFTQAGVKEWNENAVIPEGEKYIHFWAAFEQSVNNVAEMTKKYKYDNTDPECPKFYYEKKEGYRFTKDVYIDPRFILKADGLSDNVSGIDLDNISDAIKIKVVSAPNNKTRILNRVYNKMKIKERDGKISFSIDVSDEDPFLDSRISVIVKDRAGNEYEKKLDEIITFDSTVPKIINDEGNVGITNKAESDAKVLTPVQYGGELTKTLRRAVYVNDKDSYIKVVVSDNNLKKITVRVDGDEEGKTFSEDGKTTEGRKWICFGEERSDVKTYFLKISDLGLSANQDHTIEIKALDYCNSSEPVRLTVGAEGEEKEYSIFYDPKDKAKEPAFTFDVNNEVEPKREYYYGHGIDRNSIDIGVSDDNGLKKYEVSVNDTVITTETVVHGDDVTDTYTEKVTEKDADGKEIIKEVEKEETYNVPAKERHYELKLNDEQYPFIENGAPVDGKYTVKVNASDLAGNTDSGERFFVIDTTPPVAYECNYLYKINAIRHLPFGLFGNEPYVIIVKVHDPDVEDKVPGVGVKSAELKWGGETYVGKCTDGKDTFVFDGLKIGHNSTPVLIVTDELGNSANFSLVAATDKADEKDSKDKQSSDNGKKGTIQLDVRKAIIPLELEVEKPISEILPPDSFNTPEGDTDALKIYKQTCEDGHVEWWYPAETSYKVTAKDNKSGLFSVEVYENAMRREPESCYNGKTFDSMVFNGTAVYEYGVTDEGSYNLFTYAVDNARNTNRVDSKKEQYLKINLDKTKPQVTEFRFGSDADNGDTVERTTYGFFFLEDTEARVYVDDAGVSSGIEKVSLFLSNVSGENRSFTKNISEFGTEKDGRRYASFVIEKGFKGRVAATVADNVGHSSGIVNAYGNIIEDSEIHAQTSSIDIKEGASSRQNDANGVPLYNSSIPLTVTVEDSFSGIRRIEWSIADDNESGVIEVDIDGNWYNVSGDAQVIEESIEREENLITKLQFTITVDSNTNGNSVNITLTDRSGNTGSYDKSYSIDTTEPAITAVLKGGEPINGNYFNGGQTVNISITERNFDPGTVSVMVNDKVQPVQWSDQGVSITTDDTVHTGSFTIDADGEYSFTISYADMAGNYGSPHSQPRFVIDKTSPKISNNFESFGLPDDENIYYNISQKDSAKAEITVVERNFSPADMNIAVYKRTAGSSHKDDDSDWTSYYFSSDWIDGNADTHRLVIPFTEDGIYKVVMEPVDRAGNKGDFSKDGEGKYPTKTAVFETDYTVPVIVSRNENMVEADNAEFFDLYDFDRRNDPSPDVVFEDTNIDHISCEGQKYTPVYTDGREIGEIRPDTFKSETTKKVEDASVPQMVYTLKDFTSDGVYSVKLTAHDKAGNVSVLNDNTYVRMVDPTANVLAYIENSDREELTGWYSFEDEEGPISKQPDSFSDLSIVVLSKSADTRICLVDKATDASTDTNITDDAGALFDDGMYSVGAYRYTLSGDYFAKNYTADADTNLYLRVENGGAALDLGEMYIDNTDPHCDIPEHFNDWGWVRGSGAQQLTFKNVSEVLDVNDTVAYVDGETVHLSNSSESGKIPFSYDEKNSEITLTLEPGSHKVGLLLADRAGNTGSVKEVQHLAIGNYRVLIGAGSGAGGILLIILSVFAVKRFKRRKLA